jgi:hypothetical protein
MAMGGFRLTREDEDDYVEPGWKITVLCLRFMLIRQLNRFAGCGFCHFFAPHS